MAKGKKGKAADAGAAASPTAAAPPPSTPPSSSRPAAPAAHTSSSPLANTHQPLVPSSIAAPPPPSALVAVHPSRYAAECWRLSFEVPSGGSSGVGSYAEMHRVTSSDGVHSGVMKVLLHQPMSLCDQSDFVTEAISLSRLQHPCLTSVLSCGLNPMNVVWQAAVGCSAAEHMDNELESGADDSDESFAARVEWLRDAAIGLSILHDARVVHGSVHSGNLMLPLRGGSKANCDAAAAAWTDYGFISHKVAAAVNGKDVNNPHKRWIAPEQQELLKRMRALKTGQPVNPFKRSPFSNGRESHLRSDKYGPGGVFTYESDVFDFAMMAWELLSRRLFMAGVAYTVAVQRVISGCRPNPVVGSHIPPSIMDMLSKGWAIDPCERPPIRAFVAVFSHFSPPINPLLRCNVRDFLHLNYCEAPEEALAEVYRTCQQQRLQRLQCEQRLIHHPHAFDANFTRKLLRSPCIARDGEIYDTQSLNAWIKWMEHTVGHNSFLSPATLMTYNLSAAYVPIDSSGSVVLSFHQPAHSLSAQLRDMEDALSGSFPLSPPDPQSNGPSISSATAPLRELREMYEHASLPISSDALSTCQVRCKRWAKYIMEMSAKVTGLVMLRYHEVCTVGNFHMRPVWLVDENLKEFPYVLNTSFAIERGISTLHLLRRFCEGNGWGTAAQLYSSCAVELEYAFWSLWPFLHNRHLSYYNPACQGSINPSPPNPTTLILVGPGEHCKFSLLSQAIEAARPGDTLLVLADVVETDQVIAIEKQLSIVGCTPNGLVNIKARFYVAAEVQFTRVCLQGVSFVDCQPTLCCSGPSANVLIRRCHLTSAGRKEIVLVSHGATCVMKECLVYNAGDVALMVDGGSRLSMMASDVVNASVGIFVAGNSVCSMRLCSFKDCRENAIIVLDPQQKCEPREQEVEQRGSSLYIDYTTFINSGFIAPHKHVRNPSDAFMNIAFSTLLVQKYNPFRQQVYARADKDPKWLTAATLTNPAALWEHLGWPAVTRVKLSSTSYGPQPWDGGDVQWDYANWAHEPESVDGPIYRCEASAVAFALDCLYSCDSKTNTECSTPAGDQINDY